MSTNGGRIRVMATYNNLSPELKGIKSLFCCCYLGIPSLCIEGGHAMYRGSLSVLITHPCMDEVSVFSCECLSVMLCVCMFSVCDV